MEKRTGSDPAVDRTGPAVDSTTPRLKPFGWPTAAPRKDFNVGRSAEKVRVAPRPAKRPDAEGVDRDAVTLDPVGDLKASPGPVVAVAGDGHEPGDVVKPTDKLADQYEKQIEGLLQTDDLEALRTAVDALLAIKPGSARAWAARGDLLRRLDRGDEAVEPLQRAIQLDPQYAFAHADLGIVLSTMGGREQEALDHLDRAVALKPDDAATRYWRAVTLRSLGRAGEALDVLEGLLRENARAREVQIQKGLCLIELGRFEEAVELQKLNLLPDDLATALASEARTLSTRARADEALIALERAEQLGPHLVGVHVQKAELLTSLGRIEEAAAARELALAADPRNPALLLATGVDLRRSGRLDEAAARVHDALRRKPELVAGHVELAEILLAQGEPADALQATDAALDAQPENARAAQLRGQLLVALGRTDEALEALDQAIRLDAGYAWNHGLKAFALQALDRHSEGLAAAERALELDPAEVQFTVIKASMLTEVGEYAGAVVETDGIDTTVSEALTASTAAWIGLVRGLALIRVGKAAEAEPLLRKAADASPDIISRLLLSEAVRATGRRDEADESLRTMIRETLHQGSLEPADLANLGWAYRRLGEFDAAGNLAVRALSDAPSLVWPQFDFALTLVLGGNHGGGVREYLRGLEQLRGKADTWRRYGILESAVRDLDEAIGEDPALAGVDVLRGLQADLRGELNGARSARVPLAEVKGSTSSAPAPA